MQSVGVGGFVIIETGFVEVVVIDVVLLAVGRLVVVSRMVTTLKGVFGEGVRDDGGGETDSDPEAAL